MIVIPINGKNDRMGRLFKTPKHLLLHEGEAALKKTLRYMSKFGDIHVLAGEDYYDDIQIHWLPESTTVHKVKPTSNVIDTIKQVRLKGDLWIVDCDVVPIKLNKPQGDTVYTFRNKGPNNYSNFLVHEGKIINCNEKEEQFPFAGAGVYYFRDTDDFFNYSVNCTSVSQLFANMINRDLRTVYADNENEIYRLGTLPDITGGFTDNVLERTIIKRGETVMNEVMWYENYLDKKDIPKVVSFAPHSLTMEYIEADAALNIYDVVELVEKYKLYKPINHLPFDAYIDRIAFHLAKNPISGGDKLLRALSKIILYPTFAHGDLSCINIISTKKGPKLIDPLYFGNFGSYILDYAKLLFSLKFYRNDIANFNLLMQVIGTQGIGEIDVLIASESVRVATYNKKFNFIAENLIAEL